MNMRMVFQFLIPGVQHAEEANFGAEALGIPCDFDQRGGTRPEKQVVHDLLVL